VSGRLVLIVEDNEKNTKLLRDVLRAGGYETIEAESAERGIELAHTRLPSLVLMDVQLPGVGGVEALGLLRGDARTAAIPVLAVTAQAMSGDRERFLGAGFDGYVSKPVDIVQLLAVVGEHCAA
jgi:two-component system cell cycle response regulator DivK